MIRTAHALKVRRLSFMPWAALDMSSADLSLRGIKLRREIDDLDEYDVAYVELADGSVVGLQAYVHDPRQHASVLLPDAVIRSPETWNGIASEICVMLGLPLTAIHYGTAVPPESGSPCPASDSSAAAPINRRR